MVELNIKERLQQWKNENPIRKYRKESGLSQPDIAGLIGVSTYTVQRWEDGSVSPSGENLKKMSKLIDEIEESLSEWKNNRPTL
ncbi:helix-turn-helix domain-containing protein [Metabacillus arenae]|uniref:helix-turn-helix domain-containing protein n=1 Tax=Metabacillus arenae TaxID=2771434 RepID=UPI0029653B22|nr:helix-turn-helix transcriptional regulator [Metabacillus arenae]